MVSRRVLLVVTIAFSAVVGCGDPTASYSPGLTIVSGDGQTGIAGQSLGAPLVVRLADASGRPLRSDITWEVLTGGGHTMPFTSQTDAHGLATTTWALGIEGLQQQVRAIVTYFGPDSQVNTFPPVTFTATATGTATSLVIIAGDSQVAIIDDTLPAPLRVRAVTETGALVAGVHVEWSTTGGGVVLPHLPVTDVTGEVAATWVLGATTGRQTATASAWFGSSVPPFVATANAAANTLTWIGDQLPAIPSCPTVTWRGIWASVANDVVAVGSCGAILHFNGAGWNVESSGTTLDLYGVSGRSSSDIFAVGDSGTVLHYDGRTWTPIPGLPSYVRAVSIWASSSGDLFVAASDHNPPGTIFRAGAIWHFDNGGWTLQFANGNCAMAGVWGASSSDVFAVSDRSSFNALNRTTRCEQVLHYDGSTWSPYGGAAWGAISGYGPNDVYAVGLVGGCGRGGCGYASVIQYFDGTTWQVQFQSFSDFLTSVWVGPQADVVAVGSGGWILHKDGSRWRREVSGTTAPIVAVAGSDPTNVWAITANGLVLHGTRPSSAAAHARRKN